MNKIVPLFLLFLVSFSLFGDPATDSLELKLHNTKNKRKKVDLLNQLSVYNFDLDQEKGYQNALKARALGSEIGYEEGTAKAYDLLGDYFFYDSQVDSALSKYTISLSIYKGLTNDVKTGKILLKIGNLFFFTSNYNAALQYSQDALAIYNIINDKADLALIHSLLCDIFSNMGYKEKAIVHCIQSLRIYEEMDAVAAKADLLNDIGNIYLELNQLDKSEDFFNEALYISKKNNDSDEAAYSLINLGNLLVKEEKYKKAKEFYSRALQIEQEEGNIDGQAYALLHIGIANRRISDFKNALLNMKESLALSEQSLDLELRAKILAEYGLLYSEIGTYPKAIEFLRRSLSVAQKIGAAPILQTCYNNLAKYYDKLNDKENALIYFKLYMLHREELYSNQSAQKIAETETMYNLEKMEQQIQLLRSQNRIKDLESSERNLMNIWLFTGLIFVFTFSILVYRQYLIQGKANQALKFHQDTMKRQKVEIESNRDDIKKINFLLADKNTEITDSIEYAKRIQLSLLPKDDILKDSFDDHFVFYKPKDIVSGDFYWYRKIGEYIYLAIVDCTGHGVPGAFMTVLANSLLNQLVTSNEDSLLPDRVLNILDIKVRESLNQQGISLSAFEGMDIALLSFDLKKKHVFYSGAKIPLYIYSSNEFTQIKGDRFSVGGFEESEKVFTQKMFKPKKGDLLYLATDGFQDQFGGKDEKKYMKLHFKNLLKTIAELPMNQQKEKLDDVLKEWKQGYQQTDDILVMGIKV